MSEIYKVGYTKNNLVIKIYVYFGLRLVKDNIDEINKLFITDPNNKIFSDIFSTEELADIKKNNIEIIFLKDEIHIDDTIETIKKKLLLSISEINSFNEIYLFAQYFEQLNSVSVYENLTQNGKIELTKDRLIQFLLNINDASIENLENKDFYDYDDILSLGLDNQEFLITKAIGQKFIAVERNYPYTVNPFNVITYDVFLEKFVEELTTTTNKNLLMSTGNINNNMIYLCLANDVLEYAISNDLSQESTIKIYYPYLLENNINNLEQLNSNREKLRVETEKMLTTNLQKNINNINLFYEIFNNRTKELDYKEIGIKNLELIIHPEYEFNLPLDIIFKLIHATKAIPFIKYNPARRQENIYRLYTNSIATNGKKIPYLNKASIFKLMRTVGTSKSVTTYIEYYHNDNLLPITCTFENNGNIILNTQLNNSLDVNTINLILKDAVNPVINIVKDFLSQSGYKIYNFNSIMDENIEILQLEYNIHIPIEKKLNIKKIIGCLSSIFSLVSDDLDSGIIMRFKRVANYNEMDSQEAFIIEMLNNGSRELEIIQGLTSNYGMTEPQARQKLASFVSSLQVVQDAFQTRKLKIKNNPGFLTTMILEKFNNTLIIKVLGINNIQYLNTIPIYIDTLLRITQDPTSTTVIQEKIKKLCSGKEEKIVEEVEEIIAPVEQPLMENKQLTIVANELQFEDPDDDDEEQLNMLDILMDDDDDDDDEDQDLGNEIILGEEIILGNQIETEEDDEQSPVIDAEDIIEQEDDVPSPVIDAEDIIEQEDDVPSPVIDAEDMVEQEDDVPSPVIDAEDMVEQEDDVPSPVIDAEDMVEQDIVIGNEINNSNTNSSDEDTLSPLVLSENSQSSKKGGGDDDLETDITGISLTNPNPFFQRMQNRDPSLFLTDNEGKFNAYSRMCPWNVRRQPVILTDEEKDKIDTEQPGSYDEAIKYGSDPDKQFWYICPRYWSFKKNISLTEEQAKSGKYGTIIPAKAKKIPPGAGVFEFTSKNHEGDSGEYVKHYPGFLKPEAHPDGKCIPCCFKSWDSPEQRKRREYCSSQEDKVTPTSLKRVGSMEEADDYIKGADKFPLKQNRFGYLPIAIQKLLHTDNKKCQISSINKNLKEFHPCMLRHGVEFSKLQSFIACIADIYVDVSNEEPLSIIEMKEKLINSLNLDLFMTLQNGNLIEIFSNLSKKQDSDINIEKYQETKIFKNTNLNDPDQKKFLKNLILSYNNFIAFLRDNEIVINYLYLWDLICKPNPNLFTNGLNLVIIEMKNDDITNNVDILCPSNNYSSSFFDINKRTAIIMKLGNYYEPIYSFEDKKDRFEIIRRFSLKNKELLPNIKNTLEIIKKTMNEKCGPLPSMPQVYKFKTNISLVKLVKLLKKIGNYTIKNQILNYNGKVISLIVSNKDYEGILPCLPSSPLIDLTEGYVWMDDIEGYSYENTIQILNSIYKLSNEEIPCKPVIKILEDGLIVGILTLTNQFVVINPPIQDTFGDDLISIKENNYANIDKISITQNTIDEERIKNIKNIKLENNFYTIFRNTIRILLGEYKNRVIRKEIEDTVSSTTLLYLSKIRIIDRLLRQLTNNIIKYVEYKPEILKDIETITNCYMNSNDCETKKFCLSQEDSSCALLIPKNNLINNQDNEKVYYGRIADELVRYNRIKSFIFEPKAFLSFIDVKYNLREDEIILLQSSLTQEYFEDLIPAEINKYINYNTYDTTEPLQSAVYSNEVDTLIKSNEPIEQEKVDDLCEKPERSAVAGKWRNGFPLNSYELSFTNSPNICSFDIMLFIIKNNNPDLQKLTKYNLKEELLNEYLLLFETFKSDVLQVLNSNGKKDLSKQVGIGQVTINNVVMSEDYYLTNLDIWIIAKKYNLPLILYSGTTLVENSEIIKVLNDDSSGKYYFIKSPGVRPNNIPKYKLLSLENGDVKISLQSLSFELQSIIRNDIINSELQKFLENFELKEIKNRKPKLKLKVIEDKVQKKPKKKLKLVVQDE
jgi:hypothetical protein